MDAGGHFAGRHDPAAQAAADAVDELVGQPGATANGPLQSWQAELRRIREYPWLADGG